MLRALALNLLFFPETGKFLQLCAASVRKNCLNYRQPKAVMTEEAILRGCLNNDATAQRELYNRYSPKMLAVCYRFAHNREDAEDMLQEGFIKVFSQIHTFENRGAFEGWIRRIIVHTCINILKKNKKFNESVDIIYATGVMVREESVPAIIQAKQVVECIRLLPLGYRTVLNLYAIEGYSHREISNILDIEESTSRSQYTRAKAMLENILIRKRILQKPKQQDWLVAMSKR
jgi:RNA polymerase sigma factor (sigma-70 family)